MKVIAFRRHFQLQLDVRCRTCGIDDFCPFIHSLLRTILLWDASFYYIACIKFHLFVFLSFWCVVFLFMWPAGKSTVGQQGKGRCGKVGRLWTGHWSSGRSAGLVWWVAAADCKVHWNCCSCAWDLNIWTANSSYRLLVWMFSSRECQSRECLASVPHCSLISEPESSLYVRNFADLIELKRGYFALFAVKCSCREFRSLDSDSVNVTTTWVRCVYVGSLVSTSSPSRI